jgi:hypothetical protein
VIQIELGSRSWARWPTVVMNISRILRAVDENIDGLLSLDFLQQFSQVILDPRACTITFIESSRELAFLPQLDR